MKKGGCAVSFDKRKQKMDRIRAAIAKLECEGNGTESRTMMLLQKELAEMEKGRNYEKR